jgi:hypothetical protein
MELQPKQKSDKSNSVSASQIYIFFIKIFFKHLFFSSTHNDDAY